MDCIVHGGHKELDISEQFSLHTHTHTHAHTHTHNNLRKVSLVAQLIKNLPVMWETWIRSLGWDDPLKKGKATDSSILAWRTP